jgi:hypothetical protein
MRTSTASAFPSASFTRKAPAGVYGTFTVTSDITRYTTAKIFGEVGK